MLQATYEQEFTYFNGFSGPGFGALGFARADPRVGNLRGRFRCLGGFDVDQRCVRDFTRQLGVPCTHLDLFDRQQYVDYHGVEPPRGWKEATAEDIRRAAGYRHPNIVFLSPPCKGFSGLLSEKLSRSPKYQALNRLTLRGVWLMLEAFGDNPPEFFLLENVPRIETRGHDFIEEAKALLNAYGYAVAPTNHDCGKLGNLAQRRKRFLLVARHVAKVPPFLYQPPQHSLRAVGDVLSRLPLPGDPAAGPMHRIPQLQWQTWVRLALIEAGSDWRSLQKLRVVDGKLADYLILPAALRDHTLGVTRWCEHSGAINACAGPTTGRFAVQDPREHHERHKNVFRVVRWNQETGAITSGHSPANGGGAVADPRPENQNKFVKYPVTSWNLPTGTVIGGDDAGAYAVADIQCDGRFVGKGKYFVTPYDQSSNTVIGSSSTGHGAFCVSDPGRKEVQKGDPYLTSGAFGVQRWDAPSYSVAGSASYDNGPWSIAEPRDCLPAAREKLTAYIESLDGTWHRPFTTLELAALQNLFEPGEWGQFELDGNSDSRWREAIGNAVPPAAAQTIAEVMGTTLLLARSGQTFSLSAQPIWVQPLARAISLNLPLI